MKLISWNVNGLKSALKQGFDLFVDEAQADVILLQEIKTNTRFLELLPKYPHYEMYVNMPDRKGYAGLITFAKRKPDRVIKDASFDEEARVLGLEYRDLIVLNVYFPHSRRDLTRLDYKEKFFLEFTKYLRSLTSKKKPIVIGGDFNVAHQDIDLANPKRNIGHPGFTYQERELFAKLLYVGFDDSFRLYHKEGGHYTWWLQAYNARQKNIGWRLDYFLTSKEARNSIKKSYILPDVFGSDHAPIVLEADF